MTNDYCQNGVFLEDEGGKQVLAVYVGVGMSDRCERITDLTVIKAMKCIDCPVDESCVRFKYGNRIF